MTVGVEATVPPSPTPLALSGLVMLGTKASDRIPRPATGEHLPANAASRWRVHPVGAVTFRRKIGA